MLACVPVLLTHKMSSPGAILTSQTYLMPTKSEYPTHSRRPVFRVSCLNNCNCIDWAIRQCRPARCITVGQCRRATHDRCSSLAGADLDMRKCSDFNELSCEPATAVHRCCCPCVLLGFIWGYVGSRSNPQAKIIAVRLDFGKSDIKYRFDSNSEDKKQSITITATASFIQRTGGSDASSPPSPPVAISVPYDVWYPFKIDSHAGFAPPGILKTTFIIFVLTTFHLSRQSTMTL